MRPATMPLSDEQWNDLSKGIVPEDVAPWQRLAMNNWVGRQSE